MNLITVFRDKNISPSLMFNIQLFHMYGNRSRRGGCCRMHPQMIKIVILSVAKDLWNVINPIKSRDSSLRSEWHFARYVYSATTCQAGFSGVCKNWYGADMNVGLRPRFTSFVPLLLCAFVTLCLCYFVTLCLWTPKQILNSNMQYPKLDRIVLC